MEVEEKLGKGKVEINVSAAGESAHYEVEIEVRNPNPISTVVKDYVIKANSSIEESIDLIGMEGSNSLSFEFSSIPSIDLERRMAYLISYPHGCVEQTTSRAFPQLYLDDVSDLSEYQKKFIKQNVSIALDKLRSFQNAPAKVACFLTTSKGAHKALLPYPQQAFRYLDWNGPTTTCI